MSKKSTVETTDAVVETETTDTTVTEDATEKPDVAPVTTTDPVTETPDGDDVETFVPVAERSPEEQIAYWKAEAKKQQKARNDLQKKVEAEPDPEPAPQVDETALVNKYVRPAFETALVAVAKRPYEDLTTATARVKQVTDYITDLSPFLGEDGSLDTTKIETFSKTLGGSGGGSLAERLAQGATPNPGQAGSVADYEARAYEKNTSK